MVTSLWAAVAIFRQLVSCPRRLLDERPNNKTNSRPIFSLSWRYAPLKASVFRPSDVLATDTATVVQEIAKVSEELVEDDIEDDFLEISDAEDDDMDGIVNLFLSQLSVRTGNLCMPTRVRSDTAIFSTVTALSPSSKTPVFTQVIHKDFMSEKAEGISAMSSKSCPIGSPKCPPSPRSPPPSSRTPRSPPSLSRTPPNSPRNQIKSADSVKHPTYKSHYLSPRARSSPSKVVRSPRPPTKVPDASPKEENVVKTYKAENVLSPEQSVKDDLMYPDLIKTKMPISPPTINISNSCGPTDEIFKDPTSFDFLSAIKSSSNTGIDLRKNSLYLKFDPLFDMISDSEGGTSSNASKMEVTSIVNTNSSGDTLLGGDLCYDSKTLSIIDNLISLSEIKRAVQDCQHGRPEPCEGINNLAYIFDDLKAMKEAHMKEMHELKLLRQKMTSEYERKKIEINNKEKLADQANLEIAMMREVMDEYVRTIDRLTGEKEEADAACKLKLENLEDEKKSLRKHLDVLEIAFKDLLKKYDASKKVIEDMKENETILKDEIIKYQGEIARHEENYDVLKEHAMETLSNANKTIEDLKREHLVETTKLKALLRKAELTSNSLEESLEQKKKERLELVSICDDLISKVGK